MAKKKSKRKGAPKAAEKRGKKAKRNSSSRKTIATPPWFRSPFWRLQHRLSPFSLPFAPSPSDLREWNVEIVPPTFSPANPLPANGKLQVSLHRLLIEVGIAQTLATSSWDPRSWFALYRYGWDFAGTAPLLRFYSGVLKKDPRLTAVGSEEIATGITCYLLREHFDLDHISDAYECIRRKELTYVNPGSKKRPDYFCEDSQHLTVLAESKGATGTKSKIMPKIDPEGWRQVQNVTPVNLRLRNQCGRVVIGTHFCVGGSHPRSETTSIIKDPDGEPSQERNSESDMVIRLAYAKALRFIGRDPLADRLLARGEFAEPFPGIENIRPLLPGDLPILPLGLTPFGDVIGLYEPTAKALFSRATGSIREAVTESLRGFRDGRTALHSVGYALPNGVIVIHKSDELI